MTDNEIINTLGVCSAILKAKGNCNECVYYGEKDFCIANNIPAVIDLINRQKAEIERLQKELEDKQFRCDSCDRIMLTRSEHIFCIKQAKAEVAREIFAEIEKVATINLHTGEIKITYPDYIKLKKQIHKGWCGE